VRWLVKQHTATLAANIEFGQMSLLIGLLLQSTLDCCALQMVDKLD